MNPPRVASLAALAFLVLACYLAFFWRLGGYGLWDPDEGRTAVIAKELSASGNPLALTRSGEPYYDKPALYFWLVALGMKLLGLGELAVRLPSAFAASLAVGALFFFAHASGDWRWGFWSGLILATSVEFVALGRFGNMDMVFTFFFSSSLLCFLWWRQQPGARRIWPVYLFMALASLVKGPAGVVLPALIVGLSLGWKRARELSGEMRLGRGIGLIAAVAGSWYALAAAWDPYYVWTFLWDHNVLRFFTAHPEIDHGEPFYFLWAFLAAGYLPWFLFLPALAGSLWRERDPTRDFLLVWAVTVVVFFSLSHNKLGTYILPAFPPLALLTGRIMCDFIGGASTGSRPARSLLGASLLWFTLLLFVAPLTEMILGARYPYYSSALPPFWPAALFMGAALAGLAAGRKKMLPFLVSASALWLFAWFYDVKAPEVSKIRGGREMAELVNANRFREVRVVALRADSFAYYVSQPVHVVAHSGEIEGLLRENIPTVALIKDKHLVDLSGLSHSRLYVWKRVPTATALVANFPPPDA